MHQVPVSNFAWDYPAAAVCLAFVSLSANFPQSPVNQQLNVVVAKVESKSGSEQYITMPCLDVYVPLLARTLRLALPIHAVTARGAHTLKAPSVCLLLSKPKAAASASLHAKLSILQL